MAFPGSVCLYLTSACFAPRPCLPIEEIKSTKLVFKNFFYRLYFRSTALRVLPIIPILRSGRA